MLIAPEQDGESESEVAQSCWTLCNLMDHSLPGSAVHGIFQARILEWAAISFSRGSSQPRDQTQVSRIASGFFTSRASREALQTPVVVVVLLAQSCLILCDPMDCSPLGSSVHGILQARILEWVAIPFSTRHQ